MAAHTIVILALAWLCVVAGAQTNEWAWMGGAVTTRSGSVYGSLGTAAAGNTPGYRLSSETWSDHKGNLWLFGGELGFGFSCLSDLWEFNISLSQWEWIGGPQGTANETPIYGAKGTPAPANTPGARCSAFTWTDANGIFWLFGGGIPTTSGRLEVFNDLWEFNPTTNEWTWMSGPSSPNQSGVYGTLGTPGVGNTPGARGGNSSWIDSKGNLWLFGGAGYDSSGVYDGLNDLWEYNPSTGIWTWVNGPNTADQPAVTGTLGVPAAGNVPTSLPYNATWIDKRGNLWMFGGLGLNDLWEYNPATNEWAWMNGVTSSIGSAPGTYGTFGVAAAGNTPSGRTGAYSWTDAAGNFWLFGGVGADATNTESFLNDLWEFNPSTNEWAWVGGSSVANGSCPQTANWCGQPGVYGTLLTPDLTLIPGGRYDGESWTDNKGNFWLFGGDGIDQVGYGGYLSDLWQFQPNAGGQPVTATPSLSLASGTYTSWQTLTITDATPGATIYYNLNGNLPSVKYTGPIELSASEAIQVIGSANGYANSNIAFAAYTLDLPMAPAPTFSLPTGSYAASQSITIADSIPGAAIYYRIGGVPGTTFSAYSGPIAVSTSEKIEAYAVAYNYSVSQVTTAQYSIGALPATTALWTWMNGASGLASTCYTSAHTLSPCAVPGWYGTLGQPAIGNTPGGRGILAGWIDSSGNLWLFGGDGYDGAGTEGFLNDMWKYNPSTNEWTWMGGSEIIGDSCQVEVGLQYCGKPGIYGTQGVPSSGNVPGGRQWPTYWTDMSGNFWLYGGEGLDANGVLGYLDDLWEYNPSTNEWTWMGGHSAFSGLFGGFEAVYGALGTPSPQNWPGTRWYTTSWVDPSGHLWVYGGQGDGSSGLGYLNDLWEYDTSTHEWTWRNGLQFASTYEGGWTPVAAELGIASPLNSPGSRAESESWADSTGHLWLFSGFVTDSSAISYLLDDQWEFDPSDNEWAEIGYGGGLQVYGTLGTPGPGNVPASCAACPTWTDPQGNFWLFGASSNQLAVSPTGNLRDFWWFSPFTDEWTWMGGTTTAQGIYGTLGIPAAGDSPSARAHAMTWTGKDGNLWLFGGGGTDANGGLGSLNDVWEYGLSGSSATAVPQMTAAPTFSLAAGTYGSLQAVTISDSTPGAKIYYTLDGTSPSSHSPVYSGQIPVTASETIQAIAVASGYINSPPVSASYVINLPVSATPTFSVPGGMYSTSQIVMISDSMPGAMIYYTTDGTTPTTSSPVYGGALTVSTTETINAIAIASGYASSSVASAIYTIVLPPSFTLAASPGTLSVTAGGQGTVAIMVIPQNGFNSMVSFSCSGLPSGTSCSFTPSTVTPSGAAVSATLTISATSQAASHSDGHPLLPLAAMGSTVCLLVWWRRRSVVFLIFLAPVSALLLAGCGGGGSPGGGSSPSTFTATVNVSATSGSLQQTTAISLTVN